MLLDNDSINTTSLLHSQGHSCTIGSVGFSYKTLLYHLFIFHNIIPLYVNLWEEIQGDSKVTVLLNSKCFTENLVTEFGNLRLRDLKQVLPFTSSKCPPSTCKQMLTFLHKSVVAGEVLPVGSLYVVSLF